MSSMDGIPIEVRSYRSRNGPLFKIVPHVGQNSASGMRGLIRARALMRTRCR
jgi:hypothetical protein